jgi:hypothetical protein
VVVDAFRELGQGGIGIEALDDRRPAADRRASVPLPCMHPRRVTGRPTGDWALESMAQSRRGNTL